MLEPTPLLWTVAECAQAMRLSQPTIFRLIRRGDLPAIHVGRSLRISPIDVEQYVGRLRAAALAPVEAAQP